MLIFPIRTPKVPRVISPPSLYPAHILKSLKEEEDRGLTGRRKIVGTVKALIRFAFLPFSHLVSSKRKLQQVTARHQQRTDRRRRGTKARRHGKLEAVVVHTSTHPPIHPSAHACMHTLNSENRTALFPASLFVRSLPRVGSSFFSFLFLFCGSMPIRYTIPYWKLENFKRLCYFVGDLPIRHVLLPMLTFAPPKIGHLENMRTYITRKIRVRNGNIGGGTNAKNSDKMKTMSGAKGGKHLNPTWIYCYASPKVRLGVWMCQRAA